MMWTPPEGARPTSAEGSGDGTPSQPATPMDTSFAGESGEPVGWPATGVDASQPEPAASASEQGGPAPAPEPPPTAEPFVAAPAAPQAPRNPILSVSPTPPPATGSGWAVTAPAVGLREIAPGLSFSGTGARFAALLVDLIIVGIAGSLLASVLGLRAGLVPDSTYAFIDGVISTLISALYFIGFWSGGRRATPGQMLFNIQVGHAFDGAGLDIGGAARRWLGFGFFLSLFSVTTAASGVVGLVQFVWWLVLLITTISSPTKQGMHDRFAETAVVRPTAAGNGLVTACLVVAILLLVLSIASIVALIFLGGQISSILVESGTT